MTHPLMFDDDDEILARVRELCLQLPGAAEKVSHGHPCFFTKKIFAIYGAVVKGDHDHDKYARSLIFQPDPDELPALDADDRFFVPAYWGPHGWRAIDLSPPSTDWAEIGELVEDSFRQTATAKLVKELDAR